MDLQEICYQMSVLGLLAQSQGDLILELIWIDLRCHLEVTVAQQGHFGIKSTVAKKQ